MKQKAYDAVLLYLATKSEVPVLEWDTVNNDIQQGSAPYLVLEEMYAFETTLSFGEPDNICLEETGEFAVHCYVRAAETSQNARAFGERMQEAVRFTNLESGNLRIGECNPPDLVAMNDGLWTKAVVTAAYSYQYHRPLST